MHIKVPLLYTGQRGAHLATMEMVWRQQRALQATRWWGEDGKGGYSAVVFFFFHNTLSIVIYMGLAYFKGFGLGFSSIIKCSLCTARVYCSFFFQGFGKRSYTNWSSEEWSEQFLMSTAWTPSPEERERLQRPVYDRRRCCKYISLLPLPLDEKNQQVTLTVLGQFNKNGWNILFWHFFAAQFDGLNRENL